MRLIFLFYFIFLVINPSSANQIPINDDIQKATPIFELKNFCTDLGRYNNNEATASGYKKGRFWNSEGKDVWFKFTAIATDVNINVVGKNSKNTNTLINPLVALYEYNNNILIEQIGSMSTNDNLTTNYKGGLEIGNIYYVRVSAENDKTGSFDLCVNNYFPAILPGQDFLTAANLCNKDSFTESKISGAGINNQETKGTCLSNESNSAWYTWIAANDGDLSFTITPIIITDDIDWVLFDLGTKEENKIPNAQNVIRCAAGSGINCTPSYYKTGMNDISVDMNEQANCIPGQDGFVKSITLNKNHKYALLVENFSNSNNGFKIEFNGSGEFLGPSADITYDVINSCNKNQSFLFKINGSNYDELKWSFGEDADLKTANTEGPHAVKYSTPGKKTVILQALSKNGCVYTTSVLVNVFTIPSKPIIKQNKTSFCLGDVIELFTDEIENASYFWYGPNNFFANSPTALIPITKLSQAGLYKLQVKLGDCISEQAEVLIKNIEDKPVAKFETSPNAMGKYTAPFQIQFINQSINATTYLWDFGDGELSNLYSPKHKYLRDGKYQISLTAYSLNGCQNTTFLKDLTILDGTNLAIPNSFSPNDDGINDKLNINLTNLVKYSIRIFNRYGEQIFQTNNIFESWDGTWKGEQLPVGAYFYIITGLNLDGEKVKFDGSITLIR